MNNISKAIRGLKRLCPYVGFYIPPRLERRQVASGPLMTRTSMLAGSGYDGSGFYQCEPELCDMDADYIDPEGYVAIRPLGQDKLCYNIRNLRQG